MSDMRVMNRSYLPRVEKEPEPSSLDGPAAPASVIRGLPRCCLSPYMVMTTTLIKSMVDDG